MRLTGGSVLALFVALGLASAPAAARPKVKKPTVDKTAPRIKHEALLRFDAGQAVTIIAKIVDDKSGVFEPTLFIRRVGETNFTRISLTERDKKTHVFEAAVPDAALAGDFEYFLEAFDGSGNGPARVGSAEAPLRVARVLPPPPATVAATPPPAPPPTVDEEEGPSALMLGGAITAGVLTLVGASVGVAYLVYIARPPAPTAVTLHVQTSLGAP